MSHDAHLLIFIKYCYLETTWRGVILQCAWGDIQHLMMRGCVGRTVWACVQMDKQGSEGKGTSCCATRSIPSLCYTGMLFLLRPLIISLLVCFKQNGVLHKGKPQIRDIWDLSMNRFCCILRSGGCRGKMLLRLFEMRDEGHLFKLDTESPNAGWQTWQTFLIDWMDMSWQGPITNIMSLAEKVEEIVKKLERWAVQVE